ncbi:hypothetical protein GCM10023237_67130 [Streptomyces coeruleoprunus]
MPLRWASRFTPRPFLLLPLLRTGCLAALVSGQQEDAGWATRFGVECFSVQGFTRMRDDAGGRSEMRHLLPRADALLSRRWRGHEMRLASYGQWWPEWRAELDGSGVCVVAPPTGPLPEYLAEWDRVSRGWRLGGEPGFWSVTGPEELVRSGIPVG